MTPYVLIDKPLRNPFLHPAVMIWLSTARPRTDWTMLDLRSYLGLKRIHGDPSIKVSIGRFLSTETGRYSFVTK